ncbi:hypothetical protein RCL1_002265 [Eukaryota sp. TZLM3-RCL]
MREYQQITTSPPEGITAGPVSEDNILRWQFSLLGPPGSLYEGGFFCGEITFPETYPLSPPKLKFTTKILHPNVYTNGEVCMSILHNQPDPSGFETPENQWTPASSVTSILLSLMSLLSDAGFESPANIDAAVLYRSDKAEYARQVRRCVRDSLGL